MGVGAAVGGGAGFWVGLGLGEGVTKTVHFGLAHHGGRVALVMSTVGRAVSPGASVVSGVGLRRSSVPVGKSTPPPAGNDSSVPPPAAGVGAAWLARRTTSARTMSTP